ncbi:MAG: hypothetical protein A3J66_03370 [Candidatus Magasanikbacteria bacterium RIFCSPHIGHO2_02_FULL_47_14]|uniref:Undecaprenyl-phosphate alpha-N-acetylglucosaminyl 1-phosphate transferase n=1 Tax=Candidatus Magasanikbacteria bacterium RIFCSPHIGHO2_02_FULL_47_14 TaxID=1798680 RepID=A0A1F6M429_9BACT|nr:MAG: hypothetical protein A3J66_03370 [Candidatus Magasanikbacteria bacterium RIFCSPHIGHO2_02_FULL_47_14]
MYFFLAFFISLTVTPGVIWLMRRLRVIDLPKTEARKIHKKKVPLGGGLAIIIAFFACIAMAFFVFHDIGKEVPARAIIGFTLGSLVLVVGGFLDDRFRLRPLRQVIFPVVASLVAIFFGIGLKTVTNPAGGVIHLDQIVIIADLVVFFWLMAMMYTTKLLDGLDGLVSGIVAIGALVIFFLTRQPQWFQPEVGVLASILAGACLGFLCWNFYPAKIFLGEGGSLFTGYILGILAIISGSKIATTLLVMGLPMLDVVRVLIRRFQKKQPLFAGDSEHLHFRLLASGLSHRQTVLLFYGIAFLFGMSTLFLQSKEKVIALSFLFILMLLTGIFFSKRDHVQ